MLLRILFLCIAIAVLGETLLQASVSLALAAFHRQGIAAANAEFTDAVSVALEAIASAIAAGGSPPAMLPSVAPTCAAVSDDGCALAAAATIALANPSPVPCASSGCGIYLHGNDSVAEGRMGIVVDATAFSSMGGVVTTRSGTVVFRTLRVAPYAIPDGVLDATLDEPAGAAGDSGGSIPTSTSSGTLIDVVYHNAQSGATLPANVWAGLPASAPLDRNWTS